MRSARLVLMSGCLILVPGLCALSGCRPAAAPQAATAPEAAPGSQGTGVHGEEVPAGLYGDQGGEEIRPADPSLPDTILRCRAIDTFYKLSNPHIGSSKFGQPRLMVDYEKTHVGEQDGVTVEIQADDGRRHTVLLLGPTNQTRGTLEISPWAQGFGPPSFPKSLELYLTHSDERYGPQNVPVFKVSNSVTIGTMPHLTLARNWTKEELARLGKPPPNYANPNAYPKVGVDTPFAGDASFAAFPRRLVEPGGLLLGMEYRAGDWSGEKGLNTLVPIFSRDQPVVLPDRILAREGYAVGGVKVQSKRFVDALQLVFMRIGKDGQLDPSDSYTSDWFGQPGKETPKTLGGDGKRVIGIHCRQGAVLFALALVLDR